MGRARDDMINQVFAFLVGTLEGFRQTELPYLLKRIGYGGLIHRLFRTPSREEKEIKATLELFVAELWATMLAVQQAFERERVAEVIIERLVARHNVMPISPILADRVSEYTSALGNPLDLGRAIARHVGVDDSDPRRFMDLATHFSVSIGMRREALQKKFTSVG